MANLDDFLKIRNASSITTGTIDNARLPLDVKTAKIQVTNLIALYSLYNNQVQNGDIVAVNDIQSIFIVTDDTQLNNSSGYTLLVKPAAENISEIENLVKTDDYIVQVKGDMFVLRSPAQFKTDLVLVKGDVGLGNVANVDTTTTTNITDSTDKRFVTDALISNTTGTNTGDETQATIKTKLCVATTIDDGYLTTTDWNTFNSKQDNITATTSADYYRGDKTFATLNKDAVGLGNVVNLDTSTANNITDSTNKRFVTDVQLVVIGNTSGTNTGDETQATIKTKLGAATTLVDGYLTSVNWNTFNSKEPSIAATTSADYYRGDKTFAALDKTAVGLGNVANIDTSNASNISTGTLANARLTANLSDIGGITKTNDDIIQVKLGVYTNRTPAQFKTDLVLVKADVGLGNVVNLDTSTTTNITSALNKRFVTDAQLVVIGNTSGTNTGDETQATIKTKLGAATTLVDGYLTTTDWNTFNSKQPSIAATTSADYYRGDKTFATLDKTAVGLGNVANVDTTNASNISSGTLANAILSTNLTQIGNDSFNSGEIIQSFGGTLQNAALGVGTTGAVQITNTAGSILFDAPYAKGPLNQKSGFFEDFITYSATTISQILARTISGTGATTTFGVALSAADIRNGVIVFTTGTTAAGLAAVASGGLSSINFANIPVGGYEEFGACFKLPAVSNDVQSFQIVAGFGDSASGLVPTDGAYISIGGSTVGFQSNTSSNSTITSSGSLLTTVANTNYIIRIRVSNIDGSLSASYFVNGTQLGTAVTTNIPSGAGRDMGIQFGIAKILGVTPRTVELDWIYYESFKPRTINY